LKYGINCGRGFVALIGKPGMGKTTLLFQLLQQLEKSDRTIFISQAIGNPRDFMRSVLADLDIADHGGDPVWMHSEFNKFLASQSLTGKSVVMVIDEAQNLEDSVLEALRMLSNFETPRQKLIQIVLAGQPQLAEKLASPALVQLRQRIAILSRLEPLTPYESERYIENRLRVAGYDLQVPLFTSRALALVASASQGIPRNINNICFNALSLGCALQRKTIGPEVILEVLHDLDFETVRAKDGVISQLSQGQIRLGPQWESSLKASFQTVLPMFAIMLSVLALGWPARKSTRNVTDVLAPKTFPQATMATPGMPAEPQREASGATNLRNNPQNVGVATITSAFQSGALPQPMGKEEEDPTTRPITVKEGQSLSGIILTYCGRYNQELLAKTLELNPWISNPQHIEPGDHIRVRSSTARDVRSEPQHTSDALAVEVQKP